MDPGHLAPQPSIGTRAGEWWRAAQTSPMSPVEVVLSLLLAVPFLYGAWLIVFRAGGTGFGIAFAAFALSSALRLWFTRPSRRRPADRRSPEV